MVSAASLAKASAIVFLSRGMQSKPIDVNLKAKEWTYEINLFYIKVLTILMSSTSRMFLHMAIPLTQFTTRVESVTTAISVCLNIENISYARISPVYSAKLFDANPKCKDSPNTNSGSLSFLIYLSRDLLETYSPTPRVSNSVILCICLPFLTPINATAEPLYTFLKKKKILPFPDF